MGNHEISDIAPNHQLKTVNPFFDDIWEGLKAFEIRKNDRDFKVGDILWLEEYEDYGGGTGRYRQRVIVARVQYIVDHNKIDVLYKGYVCMSIIVLEKVRLDTFG